jgi:hypothetical protein
MKKFLKNMDFISRNNALYYNNKTSHQSSISGILTILSYSLLIFFMIYFSLDVIIKKKPTSYFFKKFIEEVGTYYLNTTTIFHYIQLLDENNNIRIDNESFIIFGTEEYIDRFLVNFSLEETDHYYYGNCIKKDILNNESIINDNNIYNSFCIRGFWNSTLKKNILTSDKDFIYPYLKYGSNSKKHKNIGYGIYAIKCQNISYKEKKCKSKNDIDIEYSKLLRIKFTLIDNNFDITKYKDPIDPYLLEITNHLTGNTITLNNLNFIPVNIISDDGHVFTTQKIMESYRFDLNEKLTYLKSNENSIISSFYFIMGNKQEIYYRTYKKFQDALANFGGVSKTLLMFSYILNYIINDYTINKDINHHYFTIKKEDSIKKHKIIIKNNLNFNYTIDNKIDKKNYFNSWDRSSEIRFNNKKTYINNFTLIPSNPKPIFLQSNFSNNNLNKLNILNGKYKIKGDFSFKIYLTSLFISNTPWSKRLKLIRKIWKSKISEENILYLSIEIDSINKYIYKNSQLTNRSDYS